MTFQLAMSWFGMGVVAVMAAAAVFVLIRRMATAASRETVGPVEASAESRLLDKILASSVRCEESSVRQLAALDSIAHSFDRFAKGQDNWLRKMLGGDGSGYTDMDDGAAELRERAEGFQHRYGIPWEEAMDRAKKTMVYEPNAKMRDQV